MSENDTYVTLRGTSAGDFRRVTGDTIYGINHRQFNPMIPAYRPREGMVFFTRPQLNMTDENIINNRRLAFLLDSSPLSTARAIRATLDPRLHGAGVTSMLVDPKCAFITPLSNLIMTLSDPPDEVVPVKTSKKGLYGEEHSMVDGVFDNYASYELTSTFFNPSTNHMKQLFSAWTVYMTGAFEGSVTPYWDMIVEREIDYNTRIYRLTLSKDGKYLDEIFATGASFPLVIPHSFGYDRASGPLNSKVKEHTQRFKCDGAIYNDPMLIRSFNQVVVTFNPSMSDTRRANEMVRLQYHRDISRSSIVHFNYRGYPRIDPNTLELQWWLEREYFEDPEEVINV